MKKGFTLMELIAILVLLAILSTMTYYEASKAVTFAEENTVKQSAILAIEAADHYYSEMGYINFPSEGISIKKLDIKSTGFMYGYIKLVRSKYVLYNLYDGEYCVNGTRENLVLTKGDCYSDASGNYVYYQSTTDSLPTTPAQGLPTIPTTYSSYLRFQIEDSNSLRSPQACIMNNGRQFCLAGNDLDKIDKIKEFLDYDDTWYEFEGGYKVKPVEGVTREQILANASIPDEDKYEYAEAICDLSSGLICKLFVPGNWNVIDYRVYNGEEVFSTVSNILGTNESFRCSVSPSYSICTIDEE